MRLRFSRGVITIAVIVVVLAVGISVGLYNVLKKAVPQQVTEARCSVKTDNGELGLEVEQAQMSATIAAVAARRKLPERALVIALATSLQESKLLNLKYGDLDSVGIFQQRTSQGWGTKKQLLDPVYASNKFFAALVKVKKYRKIPLAEAAQAVQRSAGGYAYAVHEDDAKLLASVFSGRIPKALHCVYPPPKAQTPMPASRAGEARRSLTRALGSTAITTERRGWLIASWSVAHAQKYGLRSVGFSGVTWSADATQDDGWKAGGKSGAGEVQLS